MPRQQYIVSDVIYMLTDLPSNRKEYSVMSVLKMHVTIISFGYSIFVVGLIVLIFSIAFDCLVW